MTLACAIAALTVAFPRPGQRMPPVDRCYMIGAAARGVTNVVVQGRDVPVYRTGAWATLVDVAPGSNTVEVVCGGETTNRTFFVEAKPSPPPAAAPERKWTKVEYTKDEARPHPSGKSPSEITIVVDPGHGGGTDSGAWSPHGIPEKTANLKVAFELRQALTNLGFKVVMTRESDVALNLYERPRCAVTNDADAFVSIHHNAPAYDRDPSDPRFHAVYAWNDIGKRLAKSINDRMAEALDGEFQSRGVIHANFVVTRNPETPSCLVEADFITSPEGEEAIFDPCHRKIVAEAIAAGIADWCR